MECDSRWVPNGHNGPAQALLPRCLSDTVKKNNINKLQK